MSAQTREIRERIIANAVWRAALLDVRERQAGVNPLLRWVRTARRAWTISRLERTMTLIEGEPR